MIERDRLGMPEDPARGGDRLPPAWREFIRFCKDLRHGEIERLSIQDGVPVLAEVTKRKIKFNGRS
jgi:hypothetical protein